MSYTDNGSLLWADAIADAVGEHLSPLFGYGDWTGAVQFVPLGPEKHYDYQRGKSGERVTLDEGVRVLVGNRVIHVTFIPGDPSRKRVYSNRTGRYQDLSQPKWKIHLFGKGSSESWGTEGRKQKTAWSKTFDGAVRRTVVMILYALKTQELSHEQRQGREERKRRSLRRKVGP